MTEHITCHTAHPRLIGLVYNLARPLRVSFQATRPGQADVVVTTAGLTAQLELRAMRIGASVIVLPEGSGYLASKIKDGTWRVLCGADILKDPSVRAPSSTRKWGALA